ncbi:alkaline phosphatase [Reyranella sp. CPCC 100927]|uniref:alkaline phosphatase D family protein n=1 Tax=Reyranella sp. CPCC 100927 TaxID=2599616 RepID=UPI0011B5F895|nr:alkaline phosphatase D family protein [Reyranella sp. CPCC 100927]TWS99614.1 alkaline phosphatase [Reyranella sp. CPCC 100927]
MRRFPTAALSRRHLLIGGALGVAAASAGGRVLAQPRFDRNPFGLGVASGDPAPDGFVIWTRVMADPLSLAPLAADAYPLIYQIADDPDFKRIVRSAEVLALPQEAHTVHVVLRDLQPGRDYWYRFRLDPDHISPAGRARTAPAPGAAVDQLDLVVASCQHYEGGYYGAWRDATRDRDRPLDAILFLGDYIYESHGGGRPGRQHHVEDNPVTLDDFRRRYALYKSDPDLQAAHAAAPWLAIWDDHEVENDYANEQSQHLMDRTAFLALRTAAYRAWWEHMPVSPALRPDRPDARLYRRVRFGDLARIDLLDGRQYRHPQPCPRPGSGGSNLVGPDCALRLDPALSMLGLAQERWLYDGFRDGGARWSLIGNQTLMAPLDFQIGAGALWRTDQWDGYPAARARLYDAMRATRLSNPIVLTGDFHAHIVGDLFDDANGSAVASEFVGSSISSGGIPRDDAWFAARLAENPHLKLFNNRYRGHLAIRMTPKSLVADLRVIDDVHDRFSQGRTLARFAVDNGKPGVIPV